MQNLFFGGHNLTRKGKIPNKSTKTIQKQNKKIKASHFAVETVGTSMEGRGRGACRQAPAGWLQEDPPKEKGCLGPELQPAVKKERGFRCSLQLRAQKNKNKNTCGLLKPHKLYQQNVLRSLKGFSDIFYFIVYFKVVFKTKHTETKPRNGLAVCSQKYKHHAVCASRAALKTITKNWNHKIKWLSYEVLEK